MVISFMPASMHAFTSFLLGLAEAVSEALTKVSLTMRFTFLVSCSERAGKPTLIIDMPVSSIIFASLTCSTYVRKTVGVLIPSRKVSSQMKTFSGSLGGRFFLSRL